jgi:hypothetical protein
VVVVDDGIVAAGGRVREPRSGEGTHGGAWEERGDEAAAQEWGGFM